MHGRRGDVIILATAAIFTSEGATIMGLGTGMDLSTGIDLSAGVYLYVGLGVLGFIAGFWFDWVSLRGPAAAKPALWILHTGLIAYSTTMLAFDTDRFPVPWWASLLGLVLLVISCLLMVYVLFINLPLRTTYIATGGKRRVVKSGAYALVRHPGVLCWIGVLAGATALLGSKPLLYTIPLWIALDIVWVAAQERLIFTHMLEGYEEYQRETPMLSPNARSISAFISSLAKTPGGEADARGT